MQRIRSIELRPGLLMRHIDVVGTLATMVKVGLALAIIGSLVFSVAVRTGIAPEFDQQIALSAQHRLEIHNGPSPSCATTPSPPQHDCYRPGPQPREFSVYYVTPQRVHSLVWFRLPPH